MDTLIINLATNQERKEYMQNILNKHGMQSYTFLEAVNGYKLEKTEINNLFDTTMAYKRYGRMLNAGEIGCTLSHFKCYKQLIKSDKNVMLILEDDITFVQDACLIDQCLSTIDTKEPMILFLSGDYWYTKINLQNGHAFSIAEVYDAVGSYAYIINKAAAQLIIEKNPLPSCTADNWSLYRRQGVKLKAAYPYIIDANIAELSSTINQTTFGEIRKNMSTSMLMWAYWISLRKKILLHKGQFVSKIRK